MRKQKHRQKARKEERQMRSQKSVRGVIWKTVKKEKWLSLGIVFAVIGAIVTALLPPLILGNIINTI